MPVAESEPYVEVANGRQGLSQRRGRRSRGGKLSQHCGALWAVCRDSLAERVRQEHALDGGLVGACPDTLRLCRSLAASKWQSFCSIRFPYAMPFIFTGMKVGVTMAIIGVIVGEFITAQIGLGYIIMFASSAGETATVLAALVLLCVAGLVLYGIVAFAELVMRRWYGGEIAVGGFV
jgi:Binding-protein-dependent transport system inner membrane component